MAPNTEKKYNYFLWFAGCLLLGMLAINGAQYMTIGILKKTAENNEKKIDFMSKDYVPMWFLEGLTTNYFYYTQEVLATISNDKTKLEEISAKYKEFQKQQVEMLQKYRGGMTMTTRSLYKD